VSQKLGGGGAGEGLEGRMSYGSSEKGRCPSNISSDW